MKLKDGTYYKNSNGLDSHIVDKCYNMAHEDIEVYFCGPPLMNQAIEKMARGRAFPW